MPAFIWLSLISVLTLLVLGAGVVLAFLFTVFPLATGMVVFTLFTVWFVTGKNSGAPHKAP